MTRTIVAVAALVLAFGVAPAYAQTSYGTTTTTQSGSTKISKADDYFIKKVTQRGMAEPDTRHARQGAGPLVSGENSCGADDQGPHQGEPRPSTHRSE